MTEVFDTWLGAIVLSDGHWAVVAEKPVWKYGAPAMLGWDEYQQEWFSHTGWSLTKPASEPPDHVIAKAAEVLLTQGFD